MVFFYLYLLQLLIRPQDFSPAFLGWPVAWMTIIPGILIGSFWNASIIRKVRLPQYYLLGLFLMVIYVSTLFNVGPFTAGTQFNLFLKRVMAFYMVFLLLNSEMKLRNGLFTYMVLSAALGVHCIMQITTGSGFGNIPPLLQYNPPRAVWCGVWDGSNTFGVLFVTTIPICLEFLSNKFPVFMRIVAGVCLPFVLLGLFFVDSRGDTLAALLMTAVYCLMKFTKRTNIAILVLAFVFLGALLPSRMANMSTDESSAHERTWIWEQSINVLRDNPLLGIGSGQFSKRSDSGLIAHSNHASIFAELGLIGYFIFISINWFTLKGLIAILATRMNPKWIIRLQPAFFEDFSMNNSISDLQVSLARILFCSLLGFLIATLFIVLLSDLQFLIFGFCVASFLIVNRNSGNNSLRYTRFDTAGIIGSMFIIIFFYHFIST